MTKKIAFSKLRADSQCIFCLVYQVMLLSSHACVSSRAVVTKTTHYYEKDDIFLAQLDSSAACKRFHPVAG